MFISFVRTIVTYILLMLVIIFVWAPNTIFCYIFPLYVSKIILWMLHLLRKVFLFGTGIVIEVEGREHIDAYDQCLIVSQHGSILEACILFNQYKPKISYILKYEIIKNRIIKPFATIYTRYHGGIPIDRSSGVKGMKSMLKLATKWKEKGYSIVIFPYGTRFTGQKVILKPGAYLLYKELNLPIIPVKFNSHKIRHTKKILGLTIFRSIKLKLEFLPPIVDPMNKEEFKAIIHEQINYDSEVTS